MLLAAPNAFDHLGVWDRFAIAECSWILFHPHDHYLLCVLESRTYPFARNIYCHAVVFRKRVVYLPHYLVGQIGRLVGELLK